METIIIGLIALVVGAGGAFVVLRFVNKRAVQEAEAEAQPEDGEVAEAAEEEGTEEAEAEEE